MILGEPGGDLLSHTVRALSSARLRFTVLFEMGRGGSKELWPPSMNLSQPETRLHKKEEGGCVTLQISSTNPSHGLKVIGSSLTGN